MENPLRISLQDLIREMGGSDFKSEQNILKALKLLPPLMLLQASVKELADYCHNFGEAQKEVWRQGESFGRRHKM